jgi:hypothetical protein
MGYAGGEEHLPKRVPALLSVKVDAVACGAFFTALIIDGGGLLSFGANECGQLGHGNTDLEVQPRRVHALAGNPVVAIACGAYHLAALTAAGTLHMCGRNGDGELGVGDVSGVNQPLPRQLPIFGEAGMATLCLSCGSYHTAAVVRLQRSQLPQLLGRHAAAALEAKAAGTSPMPRRQGADAPAPTLSAAATHTAPRRKGADGLSLPQRRSPSNLVAPAACPIVGPVSPAAAAARRRSCCGGFAPPDGAHTGFASDGDATGQGAKQSPERAQLFQEVQDRVTKGGDQGHRVRNLDMELDLLHTRLSAMVRTKLTVGQAFQMGRSQSMFVAAARSLIQPAEDGVYRRASDQTGRLAKRAGAAPPLPGIPRPGQAKSGNPCLSTSASRSTSPTPSTPSRRTSDKSGLRSSASQPVLSSPSLAAGRSPSRGSHRGRNSAETSPVHARGP